jgi:hypothetical protein
MIYRALADIAFVAHLLFVMFVVFGGLLVVIWKHAAWLHLPALAWGLLLEWNAWVCPLTPLENWLLRRSGADGYGGGFVEHYIVPIIYPDRLTHQDQFMLGMLLLAFNALVYTWAFLRHRGRANERS